MAVRRAKLTEFASDQSGSVAMLFGLCCIVLFVVVGLAVDTTRYYNLASRLQDSLDAATLAGAKHLDDAAMTDAAIKDITRNTFQADIARLGVAATTISDLNIAIDRTNSSVQTTSRVTVKSLFGPLVLMPPYVDVQRSSKVVYEMRKVELSMVLDITGSMSNNNKLQDLKSAATGIVSTLFKSALNEDSIRIAVTPYAAAVNAGDLRDLVADAAPSSSMCSSWETGQACVAADGSVADTCVIERQGTMAATDAAPYGVDRLPVVASKPYGHYSCSNSTVIPLLGKSQEQLIENTINGYTAMGFTAGHIGTAWGWYMLSPHWANIFPSESQPGAYDDRKINKTILIMTDGLFNTSYQSGPSSTEAVQVEESYGQFRALCEGMKANGINIYTVGFDLYDTRAISELQSCASAPSNFYDAKTGADLKSAFKAIADRLNSLRVAS